ncbi:MAG: hypothetical protein NT029_15515 [Armatimonadetes bacterium]|nr:hypothetical protein [Armatimonadota bacterium]
MQRPHIVTDALLRLGHALICPDCKAPVVLQHRNPDTGELDGVHVYGVHGRGFAQPSIRCGLRLWDRTLNQDTGAYSDYGAGSLRQVLLPSYMLHGLQRPSGRFVGTVGIQHRHPSARCERLIDLHGHQLSELYATWVQGDRPKPDRYWAWRGNDRALRCPGPDCPKLKLLNLAPSVGGPQEKKTEESCPYMQSRSTVGYNM